MSIPSSFFKNWNKKISSMFAFCLSFQIFLKFENIGQNWHLKASWIQILWIDARCFFKSIWLKAFTQTSQETFAFSLLTWLFNLAEVGNFWWHVSHWNLALFSCFIITCSRSLSLPGCFFSQFANWTSILFLFFL